MELTIRNLLTRPINGRSEPLFKSYDDLFNEVVTISGHDFSAKSNDQIPASKNRFKRRWYNLVTGKRNYSVDKPLEDALSKTIISKFNDNTSANEFVQQIIYALRTSNRDVLAIAKSANSTNASTLIICENEKENTYDALCNSLEASESIEIVCEKKFVKEILYNDKYLQLATIIWNSIILGIGPKVRLYVPHDDTMSIWITIRKQLESFLVHHILKQDTRINNLPIHNYTNNPFIKDFRRSIEEYWRKYNTTEFLNLSKILDNILIDATPERNSRFAMIGLKIPKDFPNPSFILNPKKEDTSIYSVKKQGLELNIRKKTSEEVYHWKKFDKAYYQQIYDNEQLCKTLTQKVRFEDVLKTIEDDKYLVLFMDDHE